MAGLKDTVHVLTCATCGTEFTYHRRKKYCRPECWPRHQTKTGLTATEYQAQQKRKTAERYRKFCLWCGVLLTWRPNLKQRVTCDPTCAALYRGRKRSESAREKAPRFSRVRFGKCLVCDAAIVARKGRVYCSIECSKELARRKESARLQEEISARPLGHCKRCGNEFVSTNGREYCSKRCLLRDERQRRGPGNARRRARKAGVAYEPVNVIEVMDRDGWKCQICGKQTPRARRGTRYSNAPEIDHRIPLALGGPHVRTNLQCACRQCNREKGYASEVGQLPLLGV